jgi:hypothetical protein
MELKTENSNALACPVDTLVMLACPFCGGEPEIKNKSVCYGHGDYPTEWSVSCKCGVGTKGTPTGYEGSDHVCKEKAVKIWNTRAI